MKEELHILIIEYLPSDAELAERELKTVLNNYTVQVVDTEEGFLQALKTFKPDLILSDYQLPAFDGLSALQLTRKKYPFMPFIILTGSMNEDTAVECMKAGADDYVIKEHIKRLGPAALNALEKKKMEQERNQAEEKIRLQNRIANIFLSIPDEEMYGEVLQIILEVLESKYGIFGYMDEDGSWVCPSMTRDIWEQCEVPDKNIVFPHEKFQGLWGKALIEKKPLYSNESLKVPEGHIPITNALDVPIIHQGELIGNFLVGNKERGYDKKDKQLLEDISVYIAPVLSARLDRDRQERRRRQIEAQLQQSQKMEAIGTLAGGVAHDFNNLLTTIIGNAGICLIQMDKNNPLREDVEEIEKAGERASALTRQLLAFSRKQVLHPQVLDLNDVISGIEKRLRRIIGEDIELKSILESDLGKIKIDPSQMEQVLKNLAVNARDAMPKGGKLTIETANVHLDKNYFQDRGVGNAPGPYVLLTISDDGVGMSQKTLLRIFDPFFTTKEQGKGTGLGLSILYGIIKQSDGFVWVDSEVGQSTTFKIFLPVAEKPAAEVNRS